MVNTTKPFSLGSISTGTLKTEDLLPAFANALKIFDPLHATIKEAYELMATWGSGEENEEMELADAILDQLTSSLHDACPPFVYFGAHPGDGADFGFWPDWDAIEDFKSHCFGGPQDGQHYEIEETRACIIFQDGDVTVNDMDNRNILWSIV